MKIRKDGLVQNGVGIVFTAYVLYDCPAKPTLCIERVIIGSYKQAEETLKKINKDAAFAELPHKRHCHGCGKLIELYSAHGKKYCEGNACRQASFMAKKQILTTLEKIDNVYHFSHKGQVQGGTITPLKKDRSGGSRYLISYMNENAVVRIVQDMEQAVKLIEKKKNDEWVCTDIKIGKETYCVVIERMTGGSVMCNANFKEIPRLHFGKIVSFMRGFMEKVKEL